MTKFAVMVFVGSMLFEANLGFAQKASDANSSVSTLPNWQYSVVSPADGNTYSASILGRSPMFHGHTSTTIQAYLVPVAFKFSNGTVFDPTTVDACSTDTAVHLVQQSPIFQTTDFTFTDATGKNPVDVGTTQYEDAFERASFWQYVAPQKNVVLPFHTLLSLTTLPVVNVTVPAADGAANPPLLVGQCAFGSMDFTWFQNYLINTLIPSLSKQGLSPANVPIFLFRDVVMYPNGGSGSCPPSCYQGDHGEFTTSSGSQTYVVADFDTTGEFGPDIAALSRELAGWMDDPYGTSASPGWVTAWPEFEPALSACETVLEVGDPVTGSEVQVTMSNSFTYNLQELAFPSWFYRQSPSVAASGLYSDGGTLTSDAGGVCQASASSANQGRKQ